MFIDCLTIQYVAGLRTGHAGFDSQPLSFRSYCLNRVCQQIFETASADYASCIAHCNGRILIPKRYLQMANIKSDVRFIGMDNTIEIWAKEVADQPFMSNEDFSNALEETLGSYPADPFVDDDDFAYDNR